MIATSRESASYVFRPGTTFVMLMPPLALISSSRPTTGLALRELLFEHGNLLLLKLNEIAHLRDVLIDGDELAVHLLQNVGFHVGSHLLKLFDRAPNLIDCFL